MVVSLIQFSLISSIGCVFTRGSASLTVVRAARAASARSIATNLTGPSRRLHVPLTPPTTSHASCHLLPAGHGFHLELLLPSVPWRTYSSWRGTSNRFENCVISSTMVRLGGGIGGGREQTRRHVFREARLERKGRQEGG